MNEDKVHEHAGEPGVPHEHAHAQTHVQTKTAHSARVVTIRAHSGLSGDILLTGFSRLLGLDDASLNDMAGAIMPELAGCLAIGQAQVRGIGGWRARVTLPHQHEHRTLADILVLLERAQMPERAREHAIRAFTLLAEAEGRVHGLKAEAVHFHEVGALDSVLDIALDCVLFDLLKADVFQVSPLPIADGQIQCAHGILPVPAPAVLELLDDIPVVPFTGQGETVTPTAIALLKALGASFGPWPAMRIVRHALVYGSREFEGAPNGAIFALGHTLQA